MSDKRTEMAKLKHQAAETVHTGAGEVGKFIRWAIAALLIGGSVGTVIGLFRMAVSWAVQSRTQHPALLFAVPLAGLLIVWLYRSCGLSTDPGTDYMLLSVPDQSGVQPRMVPLIAVSTVLTHLCGGSAGREGAAIQLGGAISGNIGHLMHLDDKDSRTITMCGMAAGFAALFGTPLASSVFAMEVVSVGVMYYAALLPCVLASVIAQRFSIFLGGEATAFSVTGIPDAADALLIVKLLLFGAACAGLAALVCIVFHNVGHLFKHWFPNRCVCIAVGGAVVVVLTLLLGTRRLQRRGHAGHRCGRWRARRPRGVLHQARPDRHHHRRRLQGRRNRPGAVHRLDVRRGLRRLFRSRRIVRGGARHGFRVLRRDELAPDVRAARL